MSWRRRWRRRSSAGLARSPGVTELTSVTSLGQSRITVQFDLEPQHRGCCARRAGRAQRRAQRPADRLPTLPTFRKANPSAAPILILALTSKTMQPSAIYDAADSVDRAAAVAGRAASPMSPSPAPSSRRSACASTRRGCRHGPVHGRRAHGDLQRQCRRADRHLRRRQTWRRPSASTTSCATPMNTIRWS